MKTKRKEKGRIDLKNVTAIEKAQPLTEECNWCDGYAFQISYGESSQNYTLYLIAGSEEERSDWINTLRTSKFSFIFSLYLTWIMQIQTNDSFFYSIYTTIKFNLCLACACFEVFCPKRNYSNVEK